jgi:hypothetical protein
MAWWIGAALGGTVLLALIIRVITYKPPEADRSSRAKMFEDALTALRAGKTYHLKNPASFDNSAEKLRFFAEALSGQLRHPVGFDDISFETSGEALFFTGVEEEEEN